MPGSEKDRARYTGWGREVGKGSLGQGGWSQTIPPSTAPVQSSGPLTLWKHKHNHIWTQSASLTHTSAKARGPWSQLRAGTRETLKEVGLEGSGRQRGL